MISLKSFKNISADINKSIPSVISKVIAFFLILIGFMGLLEAVAFFYFKKSGFLIAYCLIIGIIFLLIGIGLWRGKNWARLSGALLVIICFILAIYGVFIKGDYRAMNLRLTLFFVEPIFIWLLILDYKQCRQQSDKVDYV